MILPAICAHGHWLTAAPCRVMFANDRSLAGSLASAVKVLFKNVQTPFWDEWQVSSVAEEQLSAVHSRRDLASRLLSPSKTAYPKLNRLNTTYTFESRAKGTVVVADPYSWLEDSDVGSEVVRGFVDAQNAITSKIIAQTGSFFVLTETLKRIYEVPFYSLLLSQGPQSDEKHAYWYSSTREGAKSYYIATRDEVLAAEKTNWATPPGKKFFDPIALGTGAHISGDFSASYNGLLTSCAVANAGSDMLTVYFRNLSTPWVDALDGTVAGEGGRLPDVLMNVTFYNGQWTRDDQGVFYHTSIAAESSVGSNATSIPFLMFHRLGTPQDQDIRVLALDAYESDVWCGEITTDDGKWLVLACDIDADIKPRSRYYVAPLNQPISSQMSWIPIISDFHDALSFVTNVDQDLYFITNIDAPFWKLVRTHVDTSKAIRSGRLSDLKGETLFVDLIPEKSGYVLSDAISVNNDKLLVLYIHDIYQQLLQFDIRTGSMVTRLLPDLLGSILAISARTTINEAFVIAGTLNAPDTVYRLTWPNSQGNAVQQPTTKVNRREVITGVDWNVLQTTQAFVTTSDGVKVPILLLFRKGTRLDGSASALIYSIGGFRYSWAPSLDPSVVWWVNSFNGVFVMASVRGGLEYGERWHLDGALKKKKNTFLDVIAVAQYLVNSKIAKSGKITLVGIGVGGLTSLAVANMAPEGLFGAIFAIGALADMLQYDRFGAGPRYIGEFGDPNDPDLFDVLYDYSPLHNVNASKTYPLMVLPANLNDAEVPPWHSFKMIAELQFQLANNPAPLLMSTRVDAQDWFRETAVLFSLINRFLNITQVL